MLSHFETLLALNLCVGVIEQITMLLEQPGCTLPQIRQAMLDFERKAQVMYESWLSAPTS